VKFALFPSGLHKALKEHAPQPASSRQPSAVPSSILELREKQVNDMCAGLTRPRTHPPKPWPDPSPLTLKKWSERHPAFQTYSVHYMASQRRLLFMADLTPSERFNSFEAICFHRQLAPTTAETYWTTWLGLQKALALTPPESDKRVTKLLKARAAAYPVQFPTPASLSDIELLVETFREAHPSFAAIVMATFLLGQRISDMVQLAAFDLQLRGDLLMITIRRGKTVPSTIQPYTLWLPRLVYPAESMIECAVRAKKENRLYLFSHENSDSEREKVLHHIRDMLLSVNDSLELRSIRRGALHRMANLGTPLEQILEFSKHADVKMLMRYLNWGEQAVDRQLRMMKVLDRSTKDLTVIEELTMDGKMATLPTPRLH
jgi:hypothetical protein